MKRVFKPALTATLPVMAGYLILGFGFGIIIKANGYSIALAAAMSIFIYAGSMQYVAIGLITGGATLITIALTTLMVNIRHLFYGISMLEKYRLAGKAKPYLIFSLTDETYSLLCGELQNIAPEDRTRYELLVSLLNHFYWIAGSVAGAVAGSLISFNSQGIDFALTALFLTVFTDQWLSVKKHGPALIGLGASVACLIIFGAEHFLIPAMLIMALTLSLYREESQHD